ncbi:[Pyruvate dehydrogenase (acetyl-transferring)] kinase isozyme 3, mitochondrial [Terramyces sp. JEL0728]|nr:[Pyruvate dehydrogenase (acetyl-transferring)] kinase isozyme 3, mitochondrial [Terramyces sp. JEL0728]
MITFKRLLHNETTARMSQIATRHFRKIKVKEHLGPGTNPTKLYCLQASRIVADEITVRLAKRCKEIDDIPQIRDLEFAKQIKALYTKTCQAILPEKLAPPEEDLDKIVFGTECHDPILASKAEHLTDKLFHVLERAVARHKPIMLLAAQEENRALLDKLLTKDELQQFLTKFHIQRIAVRLLIGHCVALSRPLPMDNMIGIFCTKTPIEDIVTESVQLAEDLCMITYGCAPPIELSCTPESKNFDLLYIPSHLQHILFELLKNAMRAVIERELLKVGEYGVVNTSKLPPIIVHWRTTPEHYIFEVRDQGIGIDPDLLEKVFLFHYTTAAKPIKPGAAVV